MTEERAKHTRERGTCPALITALFLNPHIPPQCYNLSLNDYPNPPSLSPPLSQEPGGNLGLPGIGERGQRGRDARYIHT